MEEENNMLNSKIIKCSNGTMPRNNNSWVVFFHGFGGSSDTWNKQISEYSKIYDLLLVDFHGNEACTEELTVPGLCAQIIEIMDVNKIEIANIVSISSGSLVALAFAATYPERVRSMALGGGIIKFNLRTGLLLTIARILKNSVPYMNLYKFFAYAIMPGENHRRSREIFVREAEKLGHDEFCKWIDFIPQLKKNKVYISQINNLSKKISMLYIMGDCDHLFKKSIIKAAPDLKDSSVVIIPKCGHVCSIENSELFNAASIGFFVSV